MAMGRAEPGLTYWTKKQGKKEKTINASII
jgi:hypothetical protein